MMKRSGSLLLTYGSGSDPGGPKTYGYDPEHWYKGKVFGVPVQDRALPLMYA